MLMFFLFSLENTMEAALLQISLAECRPALHCLEQYSEMELFPQSLFMIPFSFPLGFVHLFMRQPCISGLSYLARTLSPNEKHYLTYISLDAVNNTAFRKTNVFNLRLAVTILLKRSIICLTDLISTYSSEKTNVAAFF